MDTPSSCVCLGLVLWQSSGSSEGNVNTAAYNDILFGAHCCPVTWQRPCVVFPVWCGRTCQVCTDPWTHTCRNEKEKEIEWLNRVMYMWWMLVFYCSLVLLFYMFCDFYMCILFVLLSGRRCRRDLALNGLLCLSKGNENEMNELECWLPNIPTSLMWLWLNGSVCLQPCSKILF